ncbi:hypothetical protein VTK56DRAFT_5936 [Thermocarpiscus australiensis]
MVGVERVRAAARLCFRRRPTTTVAAQTTTSTPAAAAAAAAGGALSVRDARSASPSSSFSPSTTTIQSLLSPPDGNHNIPEH